MPQLQPYSVPIEQGAPFVLDVANPSAGADLTQLVPNHVRWEFHTMRFTFTTDANTANRRVTYQLDDTTGTFVSYEMGGEQTDTLARTYFLTPSDLQTLNTIGGNLYGFFPRNLLLLPGMTFRILIQNIQVGDQIADFRAYGRRWVERSV